MALASALPLITSPWSKLVMPSVAETPRSEAVANCGTSGASGGVVSTVKVTGRLFSDQLPAVSIERNTMV